MITDQDVVQHFGKFPDILQSVTDEPFQGMDAQIFRGISTKSWKDAHPLGCVRQAELFARHKVIGKYCFDCFKVLIKPRTVMELFKLLMLFERIELPQNNTRKLLVEEREEISGTYKGLVYCRGLEEGNEVLKIVQQEVAEHISPKVNVALKRGCSEFEVTYPEFAVAEGERLMQYNPKWQRYEIDINMKLVSFDTSRIAFSDTGTNHQYTPRELRALQHWLRYAATIGDTSYMKISGQKLRRIPKLKRPPFK